MNFEEKKVLRRKKHAICSNLTLDKQSIAEFKKLGLLTDGMLEIIQGEAGNQAMVMKFMELIPAHITDSDSFNKLCEVLEKEHEWISDELRAELKAEKGELEIEDYINKEANMLVYREFGNSKRLSEKEKKEIQALLALRTQYAKEVWMRLLNKTQKDLIDQKEVNAEKEQHAKELIERVTSFVRVHKSRLRREGRDVPEDKDAPKGGKKKGASKTAEEDEDSMSRATKNQKLMKRLENALKDLQELTTSSLTEKDTLCDERYRALQVLQVEDPNAKLDQELEIALEKAAQELMSRKEDVRMREERAKQLKEQIASLNTTHNQNMIRRDSTIENLTAHLNQSHHKIKQTQEDIDVMKKELKSTKDELARYRAKSEMLEKTRRLGYLNEDKGDGKSKGGPGKAAGKKGDHTGNKGAARPKSSANKGNKK